MAHGALGAGGDTNGRTGLDACVVAFASSVKNLTIYPANHPRVVECVESFVQQFRAANPRDCELAFVRDKVLADGRPLQTDHLAVQWLIQRARDSGLRGVAIEARCRSDDVIRFGQALIACRPGSRTGLADAWEDETASVRPLALLIGDSHNPRGRAAEVAPAPSAHELLPHLSPALVDRLREVALAPEIGELLADIDRCRADGDDPEERQRELDVIGMVGELLPAEVPHDVDALTRVVAEVLQTVRRALDDLARGGREVRDASLLDEALDVARRFFTRETVEQRAPEQLPSGRPEDERIRANLDELLAEIAQLPRAPGLRLPEARHFDPDSPLAAVEQAGVCLFHLPANPSDERQQGRLQRLAQLTEQHPDALGPLLDSYLGHGAGDQPLTRRMALLKALVDGPHGQELIRRRGYVTDDLLRQGFPEVLSIAAVTMDRPEDLERLQAALASIATILDNGGVEAAVASGCLKDARVMALLARTGGAQARQLLDAGDVDAEDLQYTLYELVLGRRLPRAERAVLTLCAPEDLSSTWLRRLLTMSETRRIDQRVRRESGELLRSHLLSIRNKASLDDITAAIEALAHVPSKATQALLRQFARAQWWNLGGRARALRRAARAALGKETKAKP